MVTKLKVRSCLYRLHPFLSECNLCKGIQQSKRRRLLSKRPLLKCPSCFLKDTKGNSYMLQRDLYTNNIQPGKRCTKPRRTKISMEYMVSTHSSFSRAKEDSSGGLWAVHEERLCPAGQSFAAGQGYVRKQAGTQDFWCNMSAGKKWGSAPYLC